MPVLYLFHFSFKKNIHHHSEYIVWKEGSCLETMKRSEAFQVMELTGTESKKEITLPYKRLALRRHPDKPSGSKEAFQILATAYEALSSSN